MGKERTWAHFPSDDWGKAKSSSGTSSPCPRRPEHPGVGCDWAAVGGAGVGREEAGWGREEAEGGREEAGPPFSRP